MLICKDNASYRCGKIKAKIDGNTKKLNFSIIDSITPAEVRELFTDNTFYFYDDILNGRFPDTEGAMLVGLSITYNANSTCKIKIKLIEGVVNNES